MTLQYQSQSKEYKEVYEKIKSLSLALEVEQVQGTTPLVLLDGKDKITGFNNIKKHLEEIEGELRKWYYCDC